MWLVYCWCLFFFFNDTATTEIYTYLHTLSLHDALPIYPAPRHRRNAVRAHVVALHVDRDRLGKRGHPQLGGGIVRLPERPDQSRGADHEDERARFLQIGRAHV